MKRVIPFVIFLVFIISSCKKENFPEIDDIKGSWVEQSDKAFKNRLIFDGEIMYFEKETYTDTLLFHLDKKQELIFLSLKKHPNSGESNHKISFKKKESTLSVYGLFASIPENNSETTFKKE